MVITWVRYDKHIYKRYEYKKAVVGVLETIDHI